VKSLFLIHDVTEPKRHGGRIHTVNMEHYLVYQTQLLYKRATRETLRRCGEHGVVQGNDADVKGERVAIRNRDVGDIRRRVGGALTATKDQ
jgi:hypothetical protein